MEIDIENHAVKEARKRGWLAHKVKWADCRGAPDRCFIGFGKVVFIEFKRPGNKLKGQQKRMFERIRSRFPRCFVCTSAEDALAILKELENGS